MRYVAAAISVWTTATSCTAATIATKPDATDSVVEANKTQTVIRRHPVWTAIIVLVCIIGCINALTDNTQDSTTTTLTGVITISIPTQVTVQPTGTPTPRPSAAYQMATLDTGDNLDNATVAKYQRLLASLHAKTGGPHPFSGNLGTEGTISGFSGFLLTNRQFLFVLTGRRLIRIFFIVYWNGRGIALLAKLVEGEMFQPRREQETDHGKSVSGSHDPQGKNARDAFVGHRQNLLRTPVQRNEEWVRR